ncbi:hypothetical protein ACRRTK_024137 [Alexandromys fortis]
MISRCWWTPPPPTPSLERTLPVFQATLMSLLLRFLCFERDLGVFFFFKLVCSIA